MATHKAHSQLPRHQQQQQSHKGVKGSSTAAPQKQSLSLKEQQRQNSARLSKPKYVVDPKQRSNSHAHLQSNQERDVIAMMNDSSWVDRVAKEMKAQSEWSEKWTFMNDPKLYMGPDAPDKYPAKPKYYKWSPFNIINPPNGFPPSFASTPPKPPTPPADYVPPTFKITQTPPPQPRPGAGHHYTFGKRGSTSTAPSNPCSHQTDPSNASAKSSPSAARASSHYPYSTNSTSAGQYQSAYDYHPKPKLWQTQRSGPQDYYAFPPTTNHEYGWPWGGRTTLEVFGQFNANYSKQTWKDAMAEQKKGI